MKTTIIAILAGALLVAPTSTYAGTSEDIGRMRNAYLSAQQSCYVKPNDTLRHTQGRLNRMDFLWQAYIVFSHNYGRLAAYGRAAELTNEAVAILVSAHCE